MDRKAEIQKAREIDTRIAAAWSEYYTELDKVAAIERQIESYNKSLGFYRNNPARQAEYTERIARGEAKLAELRPQAQAKRNAAVALDKELYEGWNRFFLVKHIHRSQHCSSFRWNTRIGWLPNVSGLTEAEAVKEHGATLCTICFPSAPVELTTKAVDPELCPGSGKFRSTEHLTGRENAHYSPAGYCPVCLRWNTITKNGVMRKHKDDKKKRHALNS